MVLVMVERLFLAVPGGCLQFVIVVFPDHTHLLFRSYKGACLSADKSTLLIKLDVRIFTDAPRNVDVCIVDGMFLEQCHVDLPSTFGVVANATLPVLLRRANPVDFACDTYK